MQWFVKFVCLVWLSILSFTASALDIDISRYKIQEADRKKDSQPVIASATAPRFAVNTQVPAGFNYSLTTSTVPDVGAGQLVGTTQGKLAINNGAANYSVQLELPPAVHNLKPDLSLAYNSRSGNGLMGVGWSLNGLSAITRCRTSFATENAEAQKSNPRYSMGDRLCLDGQKLVVASSATAANDSTYWAAGTEYKTELDNFAKIVAYGSSANGGHSYFKVWTKDGRILTYGAEEYSQTSKIYAPNQYAGPIKIWALDKVEDAYGNNYTITYERDTVNGEYYPQKINLGYTGLVIFSYQSRTGQTPWGYDGGNKYQFSKVLDKVTTYVGSTQSTPIKQYDIDYKTSATTNRELVDTISECGYEFSNWQCAKPLRFDWQDGELGFESYTPQTDTGAPLNYLGFDDANGDGYVDSIGKYGVIAWGTESGKFKPSNYTFDAVTYGNERLYFESMQLLNSQVGKVGVVTKSRWITGETKSRTELYIAQFTPATTTVSYQWLESLNKPNAPVVVGDFNNDGLSDFVFGDYMWIQRLVSGSPTFIKSTLAGAGVGGAEPSIVDFNQDGLGDLTYVSTERSTSDMTARNRLIGVASNQQKFGGSPGMTFDANPLMPAVIPTDPTGNLYPPPGIYRTWGDFNGDGIKDYVYQHIANIGGNEYFQTADYWNVRFGRGNTTAPYYDEETTTGIPVVPLRNVLIHPGNNMRISAHYSFTYDYDKDGLEDLIVFTWLNPGQQVNVNTAKWRVHYARYINGQLSFVSSGIDPFNGLADNLTTNPIGYEADHMFRWDINNDGLPDMVLRGSVFVAKQQQPDLINKITDGFGAETKIAYSPLTGDANNGSPLYAPDATAPVFPLQPVNRSMQVVKKISSSNGQGGFNDTYFNYAGGAQNIFRGFSGFKSIVITNTATNVTSTTEYRQDWPFSGRIKKQTVKDTSGKLISITDNSYALHPQNARFPYLQYSLQKNYALSTTSESSPLGVSKTINTFNTCGSLTGQTTSVGSGFSGVDITGELSNQSAVNVYDSNNTSACHDDFLTSSTQTVAKTGNTDAKSVITEFTPNSQRDVHTRIDFKGEAIQKTTVYDRETNGVVKQITETASDVNGVQTPERITAFSDFAYSIYPQTVTNAENHITSFTYDYRFGTVLTGTAIGLTTTNTYDALGRLRQQQTPDNTVTKTITFYCSSAPVICPAGAYYGVASKVTNDAQSGKLGEPLQITFYDKLQREVRSVVYSLNGKVINQVSEYTANGYLSRVSEPYATDGIVADTSLATAWTTYSGYDALGRVTNIAGADGGSKTTTYSTDGYGFKTSDSILVVKPGGSSETQTTNSWINSLGQVTRVEDAQLNTVSYSYDTLGNLQTTLVNNKVATQIDVVHDLAGNKTYIKDPDAGVIHFDYNGFGELRKQTWQKNVIGAEKYIAYAYDRLGRQVIRIDQPASGGYIGYSWEWDTKQPGRLSSRSGNGFNEEYFYDGFSRLSRQIVTATGLSGGEFTYTYDNFGREETVKYPNGFKIQRDYHADGYQVQTRDVTVAATPKVLWTLGNTIDNRGAFNNQLWGNGVATQTGFDATSGRLSSIKSGRLSSTNTITNLYGNIQNLSYTFDSLGNLRSRTTARTNDNGVATENITEAYSYDSLNRVTASTTSGLFGRTQTYQYDSGGLGNLINRSDVLAGSSINNDVGELKYEQVRNAGVHAVTSAGGVNYSYDKYGNMIARGGESIIYNTFNKPIRIVGASITDFYYDPDHGLYKEISGTKTTYKLAGGIYELIVNGNTITQKSYVDGVIMNNHVFTGGTQSANDTLYLHTDHLGSVEATTNALGQFVNRMSFGAWGERQKSDWKPGNPTESFLTSNGFTGHDQLDSYNLVHMGGRVYDPNLGRFLSADIYIQSPYDSQNYNRYSYVGNNPLSFIDPSGYKRSNLDPSQRDFAFAMQQAMQSNIIEYCCSYARQRDPQREFAEWYHNYTERARGFFMGQDYSGNSFQQNVVLCQGGAGGACSTAVDQGRQLYPDSAFAQVPDMGQSLEDFAAEVAERTTTRGLGNSATAIKQTKNAQDALKTAKKEPTVGGGGTTDKLTAAEKTRIQNAANRSGKDIAVVGSRVNPNKKLHAKSDYDFVVDAKASTRNSLSRSLPGSKNASEGASNNQDVFRGKVDTNLPHVIFHPQ